MSKRWRGGEREIKGGGKRKEGVREREREQEREERRQRERMGRAV